MDGTWVAVQSGVWEPAAACYSASHGKWFTVPNIAKGELFYEWELDRWAPLPDPPIKEQKQ